MKDKQFDLYTDILKQAADFAEAFYRCLESKEEHTDQWNRRVGHIVAIPAIVNGSFACELYLKSFSPNSKGHGLSILFNQLPLESKKRIAAKVDHKLKEQIWYSQFLPYLQKASNTFSEWRYVFEDCHSEAFYGEGVNENIAFFEALLFALKEETCQNV